jgi:LPXTG-motif cell wall-anchored protein
MLFTTLAVTTVLCLIVPFARLYGVIGLMILFYFYTQLTLTLLGVLLLAGVTFIYLRRRNSNA